MEMAQKCKWEIALAALLLICPRDAVSAEEKGRCVTCLFWPFYSEVKNPAIGNGITVDQPKVFDDRSLIIMADQLSAALSRLSGLDQTKLTQSVGLLQGGTQNDVSRSFSISTVPSPATALIQQRDTNSNQLVPQTLVTSNAAFAPTAPALPGNPHPTI